MSQLIQFDGLKAEITVFVAPTLEIKVTDKESSDSALSTGKAIKELLKKVEARRKEITAPLVAEKALIDGHAKEISALLEKPEAHIKAELRSYEMKLEEIRLKALREAEAKRRADEKAATERLAAEREEAEGLAMFSAPKEAEKTMAAVNIAEARVAKEMSVAHNQSMKSIEANRVSGATKRWTFEITDESQIPKEFFTLDEKKIREFIRKEGREIAGVRIFQETGISFR